MKNNKMRITQLEGWSWRKRALSFFGIFGAIWLFVEPLLALIGNSGLFAIIGIWGYILLILVSISATAISESITKLNALGKLVFLSFDVILTESGLVFSVEAPQEMRTDIFVQLFLEKAKENTHENSILNHAPLYDNYLFVKKGGSDWNQVNSNKTLLENDITPESTCKIVGKIKKDYEYADMW